MLRMMLRPRWVLALLAALAIAAGFAVLGQWQLSRAISSAVVEERATEETQPLTEVAEPGGPIRETAIGQKVTLDGSWVPGDEQLVSGRLNGGQSGFWVVSRFSVDATGGPAIPIARGWASDEEDARRVADALADASDGPTSVTGRLLPTESPVLPAEDADPHSMTTVSVAALINIWSDFGDTPVYSAYVVDADAPAGLEVIDSPPPDQQVQLNWLNVFYAVEWVVFAGFAVFLWFRLVKDAWLREQEEAEALRQAEGPEADSALVE